VIHGGPFGGLWLPNDAIVTTDRDLLEHGLKRGCAPYEVMRLQPLVVIQLGYTRAKNEMLSGIVWEVVVARRDAYQAPTWLLISEDPALGPHYALNWKTKKTIASWKHIQLWGDGELECNLRKASGSSDPADCDVGTAEWYDDLQEFQIEEAFSS